MFEHPPTHIPAEIVLIWIAFEKLSKTKMILALHLHRLVGPRVLSPSFAHFVQSLNSLQTHQISHLKRLLLFNDFELAFKTKDLLLFCGFLQFCLGFWIIQTFVTNRRTVILIRYGRIDAVCPLALPGSFLLAEGKLTFKNEGRLKILFDNSRLLFFGGIPFLGQTGKIHLGRISWDIQFLLGLIRSVDLSVALLVTQNLILENVLQILELIKAVFAVKNFP